MSIWKNEQKKLFLFVINDYYFLRFLIYDYGLWIPLELRSFRANMMSRTFRLDSNKAWNNCPWLRALPSLRACWWRGFPSCLNILFSAPALLLLFPTTQLQREKGIPIPLSWKRGSVPLLSNKESNFDFSLSNSQIPPLCFPTGSSFKYWLRIIELRLSEPIAMVWQEAIYKNCFRDKSFPRNSFSKRKN